MYCKLIEEAVREAQGDTDAERESELETRVDLKTDAFLPAEYVRGEAQRMEMYKRVSLLKTRDDREDVIEEMVDRFGEPPLPVMNLIDIAHLRALCGRLGVSRVTYTTGTMLFHIEEKYLRDPLALVDAMQKTDKRLLLSAQRKPAMLLRDKRLPAEDMLRAAVPVLEKLLAYMGKDTHTEKAAEQD